MENLSHQYVQLQAFALTTMVVHVTTLGIPSFLVLDKHPDMMLAMRVWEADAWCYFEKSSLFSVPADRFRSCALSMISDCGSLQMSFLYPC